ncbi:MAG TPA: FAD:protein FMN transferase [Gaiellaceae bacterium]
MGTTIELLVEADDAEQAFDASAAEFERLEQVMSRFRPTSELSRLNRDGVIDASQELAEVVELALAARERTGGRFDPTVHDALVGLGYDRTFAEIDPDNATPATPARCGGGVNVDGRRIAVEPGYRLDLGGIGKGFAAERVAQVLALAGPCLVNAGGDVAVRGVPAQGTWPVAVDASLTLGLDRGGLATSGCDRRRWRRSGAEIHHLIDPATGLPAVTDLIRVTAVGADAVDAEVLAKTLFLGGSGAAIASDVPAVLVTGDGRTIRTGGL